MSFTDNPKRNLNPTPAARVAMVMFGDEYAAQKGGSMDFWDQLSEGKKARCLMVAEEITFDAYRTGFMDGYNQEESLKTPGVEAQNLARKYINATK